MVKNRKNINANLTSVLKGLVTLELNFHAIKNTNI